MKLYITQTSKFKVRLPPRNLDFLLMESQRFMKIIYSKFKVWSPAQLISWENLEPRPITDIGCSQSCHEILTFLFMESIILLKYSLNTHYKNELSQNKFLMKLYITQTSKFKVWSPAQLISWENLEPRPIRRYRLLTKFRLFVDGINLFMKIIFEYTFKNWIITKKISNEALYNSNFKVQSLVSSPAHQLRELGTQAHTDI